MFSISPHVMCALTFWNCLIYVSTWHCVALQKPHSCLMICLLNLDKYHLIQFYLVISLWLGSFPSQFFWVLSCLWRVSLVPFHSAWTTWGTYHVRLYQNLSSIILRLSHRLSVSSVLNSSFPQEHGHQHLNICIAVERLLMLVEV
jgi:hypothetical protein